MNMEWVEEYRDKLNKAKELLIEATSILPECGIRDDYEITEYERYLIIDVIKVIYGHAEAPWINEALSKQ